MAATDTTQTTQFSDKLTSVLSREFSDFQQLLTCRQLTAGASQETYRVVYASEQGEQTLALRRAQPGSENESSVGGISLTAEAQLMRLAGEKGIPSPKILYQLQAKDELGSGFFMSWLDGETMGHRINRKDEFAKVRSSLARRCGEILGQIHSIDWRAEKLEDVLEVTDTRAQIEQTWSHYKALNVPVPMIDYTARWLLDNLPENSRTTLVHSDFRNGNLMVNSREIAAVLDWELAHIGDPIQDLGWLCVNSWRFGNRELPVGGFGTVKELLAGYQSETNIKVSEQDLKFWEVYGSFWWAVTTLIMAHTWRTGETPSLERPVIGRRSSEAQMDCVNLLIPGEYQLPQERAGLDHGTQLPMPAELLSGVGDFLKHTVAGQMQPRDQFLANVAANSLSIAQRELQYGAGLARSEHLRLTELLGNQEDLDQLRWCLVNRLREDLELDLPGLHEHLRLTVAGQLFIDQPKYSALNN